jgi:hypothetical protein
VRQKYGAYREAWNLLQETGLTIQVCCEEEWAEAWEGQSVAQANPEVPFGSAQDGLSLRSE